MSKERADSPPSTFGVARWLFLRLLGVTFLIAFVSLWTQVSGLVGARGILPVGEYLDAARQQLGPGRFLALPTLSWFSASDGLLHLQCAAGVVGSLTLVAGFATRPVLVGLWALYLSLSVAGQVFFSFQWDVLLLETAFVALFIAPAGWRPLGPRPGPVPVLGRWVLWLLLFKLMVLSGLTKLLSGDPTWRDLTAMEYHYWTQPLPTWVGYWAHQLPAAMQRVSVVAMFVVEIGLPFAILAPRMIRHLAVAGLVGFQVLISVTGNYNFFGLLTVGLCVLLLDDRLFARLVPVRWREPASLSGVRPPWRRRLVTGVAAAVMVASGLAFVRELLPRRDGFPGVLLRPIAPLRTINGYGLFRVMTRERPEIVVEVSDDGIEWQEHPFKWKPGEVTRRPRFVAPHQPRLDWQMWFAALDPQRNIYWLRRLLDRLLEGSEPVTALMGESPLPGGRPAFVRLSYYRYEFSEPSLRRETGAWWQREFQGPLTRPVGRTPE